MAEEKDRWDKLDVLLKPAGGVSAAIAAAIIGFVASNYLQRQQIEETNSRVFADIMSRREDADSTLRKEMFNSVVSAFFGNAPLDPGQQTLDLELLAYNFHEALDLGPLFKEVRNTLQLKIDGAIHDGPEDDIGRYEGYLQRLESAARNIIEKQAAGLEEAGRYKRGQSIYFSELESHPEGIVVIDREILGDRHFKLEVLGAYQKEKELKIKLTVWSRKADGSWDYVSPVFRLSFFDFPMIDNTRLPDGQRCAVVLRDFSETSAEIELMYFAGSKASLKERPYYDELVQYLLKQRQILQAD